MTARPNTRGPRADGASGAARGRSGQNSPIAGRPMTPRPQLDPTPDLPLAFYGWRAGRDGHVYAATAPMTHGRPNPAREVPIGTLARAGRVWIALSPGGLEFRGARQADAGAALYRWHAAREAAHGGTIEGRHQRVAASTRAPGAPR